MLFGFHHFIHIIQIGDNNICYLKSDHNHAYVVYIQFIALKSKPLLLANILTIILNKSSSHADNKACLRYSLVTKKCIANVHVNFLVLPNN